MILPVLPHSIHPVTALGLLLMSQNFPRFLVFRITLLTLRDPKGTVIGLVSAIKTVALLVFLLQKKKRKASGPFPVNLDDIWTDRYIDKSRENGQEWEMREKCMTSVARHFRGAKMLNNFIFSSFFFLFSFFFHQEHYFQRRHAYWLSPDPKIPRGDM